MIKTWPKVFVYGTLKRGYGNNRCLANSKFLGEAVSTTARYKLYASGIPFLTEPGDAKIKGELWEVSPEDFARCDRLEGHPYAYCRQRRRFALPDGTVVRAWVYLYPQRSAGGRISAALDGVAEWKPFGDPQPHSADRFLQP